MKKKPTILAVDDTEINLDILVGILKEYDVIPALSGKDALQIVREELVDLILLDINMPDMDGFEVCKRLKADEQTKHIPVIFVTVKQGEQDIKQGFELGIADYVAKPFRPTELLGRITTHLELKRYRDHLEDLVKERTEDLMKAKEQAEASEKAKSEFLANISHELRTPMHHVLSYSYLGRKRFNTSNDMTLDCFDNITDAGNRMMDLVDNLLDISKLESGQVDYQMKKIDLALILADLTSEFSTVIQEKSIHFEIKKTKLTTFISCDELKIGQVLRNLISNALKFTPTSKSVTVMFETEELLTGKIQTDKKTISALMVRIKDEGVGIPESELETIFDKFIQSSKTKTGAGGVGLGLSICKDVIEQHHGKIWAENNPDGGATFSFMLPYEQEVA